MRADAKLVRITSENAKDYFDFWLGLYRHPKVNPFFFRPIATDDASMRQDYDRYANSNNVEFYIFETTAGCPIGTARITFFSGLRSHVAMFNAVAIHPDFHSQGFGTLMLQQLIAHVETNHPKITQLELAYEGDNKSARHLYETKLKFQQKANYEDWWIRFEPELKAKYPWYTDERCDVLYLKSAPEKQDVSHLNHTTIIDTPKLHPDFSLIASTQPDLSLILKNYNDAEKVLLQKILAEPHQQLFTLCKDEKPVAVLAFRTYHNLLRLTHAVTMPCVAFANNLESEIIAAFIANAIDLYRQKNTGVFHFSASEEDTTENWYTVNHSQIETLAKALNLAGFNFLGAYENYFCDEQNKYDALLCFAAIYLGIKDALQCVQVSEIPEVLKSQLAKIISTFEDSANLSAKVQYLIYKMVRIAAYPQDYSQSEKLANIAVCLAKLQSWSGYGAIAAQIKILTELLEKIIKADSKVQNQMFTTKSSTQEALVSTTENVFN